MTLFPGWDSPGFVKGAHRILEFASIVGFFACAGCELFAHLRPSAEKRFERGAIAFFFLAVIMELVAYPYGLRNDELADQRARQQGFAISMLGKEAQQVHEQLKQALGDSTLAMSKARNAEQASGRAIEKSSKAQGAASTALNLAKGARQEADSFERDIRSAEEHLTKLEESIAWRAPSVELIKQLAPGLQKFTGQRYSVIFDPNQPERLFLFGWISRLLEESKWRFGTFGYGTELKLPSTNILVWVTPAAPEQTINAARALVDAFTRANLAASFFQSGWGPPPEATPADLIKVVIFEKGPTVEFRSAH